MDSLALVPELREKFFKKLEEEGAPDPRGFHPADIAKIKNTDDWLKRFLQHYENNVSEALSMLWESCEWRRKFNVNEICEDNVRRDYLEDGVCFSYKDGKDKDGRFLFVVKSKLHVKGARDFSELQRCIIYWFERLERESNGKQISLFFDMAETGLSNMDMEFTKYLIGLFKNYYPNFLNYIIIFDMPWVLNAAFKVIKSWLPAKAIPKIKFVNKSNLKEFVDPNDALKCWGGNNDYVFKFVPEARTAEATLNGKLENKKVHFADGSPLTEQQASGFGDETREESLLSVEPEAIAFVKEGNEITGKISLTNLTTDKCLSYKIKTTSPEKFRVKPSTGTLLPAQNCSVTVTLQPGFNIRGLLHNDRFLVMCLPLKDAKVTSQELSEFWKSVGKAREEHRLRCRDGVTENGDTLRPNSILSANSSSGDRTIDALFCKINHLEESHKKLHCEFSSLRRLLLVSITLTAVMAIAIVYVLRTDVKNSLEDRECYGQNCYAYNP